MLEDLDSFKLAFPLMKIGRCMGILSYVMGDSQNRLIYWRNYDAVTFVLHLFGLGFILFTFSYSRVRASPILVAFDLANLILTYIQCVLLITYAKIYNPRIIAVWNDMFEVESTLNKYTLEKRNFKISILLLVYLEIIFLLAILIWFTLTFLIYSYPFYEFLKTLAILCYVYGTQFFLTAQLYVFFTACKLTFRKLNCALVLKFGVATARCSSETSEDISFVRKISSCYQNMNDLMIRGGKATSISTLVVFGVFICALIMQSINILTGALAKEQQKPLFYIASFGSMSFYAAKILLIIKCSADCTKVVSSAKAVIFEVMMNVRDPSLKKELNAFSLQMLHEEVKITAAGFFEVDYPLILSIVGALSTYIVILVQSDVYIQKQ